MYVCLSVCLYVCIYVCLLACLSACLPVCLSACLSVCLSVCIVVCPSVGLCLGGPCRRPLYVFLYSTVVAITIAPGRSPSGTPPKSQQSDDLAYCGDISSVKIFTVPCAAGWFNIQTR